MPEAHGPVEAGPATESAVESTQTLDAELAPEEAGADLDMGLGLAGAGYPAATRAGEAPPMPAGLHARAIGRVQRHQGNFAAQRMLKRAPVQRVVPFPGSKSNVDHKGVTPPEIAALKSEETVWAKFKELYNKDGKAGVNVFIHNTNLPLRRGPNTIQRAPDDDDWLAERIENASGGGQPLDPQAQAQLEAGLGDNLSGVRVHIDAEAAQLAGAVDAVAFTSGRDIFFGPGTYQPRTSEGLELLAHEAAHTVQQAARPVAGTPGAGGVLVSDPADPFEQAAVRTAHHVMQAANASQATRQIDNAPAPNGQTVQRAERPKEDEEEQKKLPAEPIWPNLATPKKPEELV